MARWNSVLVFAGVIEGLHVAEADREVAYLWDWDVNFNVFMLLVRIPRSLVAGRPVERLIMRRIWSIGGDDM